MSRSLEMKKLGREGPFFLFFALPIAKHFLPSTLLLKRVVYLLLLLLETQFRWSLFR